MARGDLRRVMLTAFTGPEHVDRRASGREVRQDGGVARRQLRSVMHQQGNPGTRRQRQHRRQVVRHRNYGKQRPQRFRVAQLA